MIVAERMMRPTHGWCALLLDLALQPEVTHGLAHLHATEQVDDALAPPQ
jgi:hypothetical protein